MTSVEKILQLRQLIVEALCRRADSDYWILAAPYIRNVGDHLIFQGEMDFLRQFGRACKGVHSIRTFSFPDIPVNDVIFIHGGGFLGDVWGTAHLNFVNRVIARYGDNQIVIFPQSTCFKDQELLSKTQAIWTAHGNLVVCARDQQSFEFLKGNFPKTKVLLVPDMAFYVDMSAWQVGGVETKRDRRLVFMRWDREVKDPELLVRVQQKLGCEARDWPTVRNGNGAYRKILNLVHEGKMAEADEFFLEEFHLQIMRTGIEFLSSYQEIYTARLHGLILSLLMDKPRIAFVDNSYGKIGSFYRTWLSDADGVTEIGDVADIPVPSSATPEITVIVAAHKRPELLKTALDSVLTQKDVRVEVIVVNGVAEPDDVDDVVHDYPLFIYVKNANCLTLSSKHLIGLKLATANYIHFLDDDDYLTDERFFRKALDLLKGNDRLSLVAGNCDRRVEGADGTSFGIEKYPLERYGLVNGLELFQKLQIGIRKPISTAAIFRKSALVSGEQLFECSDSSLFLKALLAGDAYLFDDVVANYRVWDQSMTRGRGSDLAFKLNVIRQKEALFECARGKIADPLGWWCATFKMNYTYFEKSFASDDERLALAEWGIEHLHGSVELEAFCREKCAALEWRKSPRIQLDYFTAWPNFGDLLSAKLIERLLKRPVDVASRESAELMAAGSLFGLGNKLYYGTEPREIPRSRLKLVWGSGFHGEDIPDGLLYRWYSLKILGVRGRLSENILRKIGYLKEGEKCALGDPGLLYADQLLDWKSIPKQYDLALVPHRYDQEEGRRISEDLKSRGISVVFVDVMNPDPLEPLRLIAASRKVLSSSLHGLIVADSMGIPNRRVVFDGFDEDERRKLSISHFKFTDYYSAFGLADPGYVMSGQLKREPESVISGVVAPQIPAVLVEKRKTALLESFQDVCRELAKTRRKVLVVSNGDPKVANPFVSLTIRELQNRGLDVDSGVECFFAGAEGYDIVHFEWPEDLVRWRLGTVTASQLDEIEARILRLKRFGVVLTYTRHNSRPHTRASALTERLYRIVEENVDAVFHMGEFSRSELRSSRSADLKIADYIVPHHLPTSVYDPRDREEARKALGIDPEAEVVVAFGAFRNADEVQLTKAAFAGCSSARKVLLAPRMDDNAARTDNQTLALMLSAADVVFIQRVSILNSGNLPLGFMYGKVVVGPCCGNVGEILEATGNPTFDPTDCEDAAHALDRGLELARAGKGEANESYAFAHWRPDQIGELMATAYDDLIVRQGEVLISKSDVCAVLVERIAARQGDALARKTLRDEIAKRDGLLKEKTRQLAESQQRRKEVWDQREAMKVSLQEVRTKLAESQQRRKEVWDQREAMKASLQEVRTKLAESQKRRKELWDMLETRKSELAVTRQQRDVLEQGLRSYKDRLDLIRDEIEVVQKSIKEEC